MMGGIGRFGNNSGAKPPNVPKQDLRPDAKGGQGVAPHVPPPSKAGASSCPPAQHAHRLAQHLAPIRQDLQQSERHAAQQSVSDGRPAVSGHRVDAALPAATARPPKRGLAARLRDAFKWTSKLDRHRSDDHAAKDVTGQQPRGEVTNAGLAPKPRELGPERLGRAEPREPGPGLLRPSPRGPSMAALRLPSTQTQAGGPATQARAGAWVNHEALPLGPAAQRLRHADHGELVIARQAKPPDTRAVYFDIQLGQGRNALSDRLAMYVNNEDATYDGRPTLGCNDPSLTTGMRGRGVGSVFLRSAAQAAQELGVSVVVDGAVAPAMQQICVNAGMQEDSINNYIGDPKDMLRALQAHLAGKGWVDDVRPQPRGA